MALNYKNKFGEIKISNSVLAEIASEEVMSSYGVVGLAFRNASDGLMTLLKRDNITKGVRIESKDDGIIVHLDIIVEYGVRINVVAQNIIDTVKYRIESLTGIKVESVQVYIQGIRVQ